MVNGIVPNLDFKLAESIKILESYSFLNNESELESILNQRPIDKMYSGEELFIKTEKENKTIYDLFYHNFHIHISVSDNEKIFSIRLKKEEDAWAWNGEKEIDFSHPTNETYEIYVWYDVPVLDFTNCVGYNYKSGTWDKYFYKTIHKYIKEVDGITDKSKFNEYYK